VQQVVGIVHLYTCEPLALCRSGLIQEARREADYGPE